MKVVVLGGGVTGLSAAWDLQKNGNEVTILEKEGVVGGLAGGFWEKGWEWPLERAYHHIFSNDQDIARFAKEVGFSPFIFQRPLTGALVKKGNNYRIFPVDSPIDFLLFPHLPILSKLRAGIVLAFLKYTPFLSLFEKTTSEAFIKKTMGEDVWKGLWQPLFRKKFGKYAEYILASFIWARINKRTPVLGYPEGGFQSFCTFVAKKFVEQRGGVVCDFTVEEIQKQKDTFLVVGKDKEGKLSQFVADKIISTLPYPITLHIARRILPEGYAKQQNKRKYLFAINLILKGREKVLEKAYWLNVGAKEILIMGIIQHTNFVSSAHYGGEEICYCAWYVDGDSPLLLKNEQEMVDYVFPYLQLINPRLKTKPEVAKLSKAPYAQPIFDAQFATIDRSFTTPVPGFFIANMDMTYPYDRGTNYAVKLGRKVSKLITNKI